MKASPLAPFFIKNLVIQLVKSHDLDCGNLGSSPSEGIFLSFISVIVAHLSVEQIAAEHNRYEAPLFEMMIISCSSIVEHSVDNRETAEHNRAGGFIS